MARKKDPMPLPGPAPAQPRPARAAGAAFVLLGILLVAATLRAPITSVAPLLAMIQRDTGLGTAAAGALTTLPLLAFAAVSPFGAPIARRLGLERSLAWALAAMAAGVALRSAGPAWCLYAGTWIVGMGVAVGNVMLPSLVKRDFPGKAAAMTSAYALSMGLAAALGSALAVPMAQAWGWRPALAVFAALPVAALALWAWKAMPPARQAGSGAAARDGGGGIWRSALAWQVTLFLGLNSTIYYVAIGWLPTILIDAGFSPARAGSLHGLLQLAGALPGLALVPLLARLRDQRGVAAGACGVTALSLLGLIAAPQFAPLWAVLFGVGTGASVILGLAFISLRAASVRQSVALSGMAQCIGYLLAATGPVAMGFLHDALGGWTVPLGACAALTVLTGAAGWLAGGNRHIGDPKPAPCGQAPRRS